MSFKKDKNLTNKRYISLLEAARIYGCTQKHFALMARQGKLKAIKIGRDWMTTFQWLEEYTNYIDLANGNGGKIPEISQFAKKIFVLSLVSVMLFAFFASAYTSFKDGVLQIPKPIEDFIVKISSNNTQDINKLPAQAIIETNKILAASFNLENVLKNIKHSKIGTSVIDTVETIILGIKAVDRKSNAFFNPVLRDVLAFFDKILSDSGSFVINLSSNTIKSIGRIPSFFSFKSLTPFYYNYDTSDQSFVSIRELYQKLRDMRELIEGKTIVINKETQQIIQYITSVTPVQKEVAVIKDQDLLNAQFAVFRNEVLAQIAGDITDFQSKIGSQIITQNNYYYSEAVAAGGINNVNNEVDFNENVDMAKNLTVVGTIIGGTISDGILTIGSGNISGGDTLSFTHASISDDLTINNINISDNLIVENFTGTHVSVSDDLTIGDNITFSDSLASVSGNFLVGGNVGIGTTIPGALLGIQDDDLSDYLFAVSSISTGDLFSVAHNGNTGIGTIPTDYSKLVVSASATDLNAITNNVDSHLTINPNATNGDFSNIYSSTDVESDSTQAMWRIMGDSSTVRNYGSGNINIMEVVNSWGQHNGAGTITHLAGYESENYGDGTNGGKITNSHNYYGYAYYDNNMNVTNNYGIRIDWSSLLYTSSNIQTNYGAYIGKPIKDATSTIGTNYGIYLGDQAVGSTSYAIYSAGGQNYLAGNLGIGTSSPDYALDVAGQITASSSYFTGLTNMKHASISDDLTIGDNITFSDSLASISGDFYFGDGLLVSNVSDGGISVSGNFEVSGNVEFGDATTDVLIVNSYVGSDLIPDNNTRSIGTTDNRWRYGYFDELTVATISATGADIGGTINQAFIINSDNVSDDTEYSYLTFERGDPITNASLKWDYANTRFDFNFPVNIQGGASISDDLTIGDNITFSDSLASISSTLNLDGILVSSGTASSTFAGDLDIEGDVNIGNNDLYVDASTGNVGIGTTAPAYPLHVLGSTYLQGTTYLGDTNNYMSSANIQFYNASVANIYNYHASGALALGAGGVERMRILSTGNVGINDTDPAYALSIDGTASISDDFYVGNDMLFSDLSENTIYSSASWDISGNLEFDNLSVTHASISDDLSVVNNIHISSGILDIDGTASSTFAGDLDIEGDVNIGNNDLYVDASSGRVGIGTTSPLAPLSVGSSSQFQVSSAGAITAPTSTNTINNLIINAGAL
ncbi:MAG: helix-turn-helix domain-containing protein, partial [Candidatus Portnoybacteria bacterium]|nr:helix-turn-helix domain-containing protein [Candidatus Portnoybacteria bacterium]